MSQESSYDILIVEDEAAIARLIEIHLQRAGLSTQCCSDGHQAVDLLSENHYRLLVLDRMIPGLRGLDVLRWLRKMGKTQYLPVLMVTALGQMEEKVRGLNEGADDYLAKPFEPEELIARVQALLRRSAHQNQAVPKKSVMDLDMDAMEVRIAGTRVDLRPLEFRVLQALMAKPDKVRSRSYLLDYAWGVNAFVEERTVDVTIKRLREALSEHGMGDCIVTVRGSGYRFTPKTS